MTIQLHITCFSATSLRARVYCAPPLVALLPAHSEFDSEAVAAAAAQLRVLRFDFEDHVHLHGAAPRSPCRALWRGFMLSAERYAQLHSELAFLNVHLVTTPKEYERVLYYPQAYEALAPLSPPATWVPVPQYQPGTVVPRSVFVGAAQEAASWPGCEYVMIKDYLKAVKEQGRFFKVPVEEAAEYASELVHARGAKFERGVVFKQWVQLALHAGELNEWRLWFCRSTMLSMHPNSFQGDTAPPPPATAIDAAAAAATRLDSPFLAIDLAELEDGGWICLESNDGGASGPAPQQDLREFWRTLREAV